MISAIFNYFFLDAECNGFASRKVTGKGRSAYGKEKAKDVVEATGPGVFAVHASGNPLVGKIDVFLPAHAFEQAKEMVCVAKMTGSFGHAHVEPDLKAGRAVRWL